MGKDLGRARLWAVSAMYSIERAWCVETRNLLSVVRANDKAHALAIGQRQARTDAPGCRDIKVAVVPIPAPAQPPSDTSHE